MAEPDDAEKLARKRFMVMNIVRIIGVVSTLLGVLMVTGAIGWPERPGYFLLAIGLFSIFVVPTILARRWSTRNRP